MNQILSFFRRLCLFIVGIVIFPTINISAQYAENIVEPLVIASSSQTGQSDLSTTLNFQVQDVKAHQLNLLTFIPTIPFSAEAILIFYYTSTLPYYLTIGAERAGVGFTYVAQNLFAVASLGYLNMIAVRFSLSQLGITPGTQWPFSAALRIYLHYSQQPVPTPGPDFYQYDLSVSQMDDDASNEYADSTGEEPPIIEGDPPPNLESPVVDDVHVSFKMPNIDLNNSSNPANSGYAGDKNACAPASASNSLIWLSQTFNGINIPFSHRDLLDSLSRYMGRAANSGVDIKDFIEGKLRFIKSHNLPIQIKFQSDHITGDINIPGGISARNMNDGKYPTWNFLKKEIADSEDVELMYKWNDGTKMRGHAVAVTGAYETADNKKSIGIKHDLTQNDTGGTVQEFPEITEDSHNRLVLHRVGAKRYVSSIVSESPGTPFTSVGDEIQNSPLEFYLGQNYPNPFNPITTITYSIPNSSRVTIKVFDILGNEIAALIDEYKNIGTYAVNWNASNFSSGVYFYKITAGRFTATKKLVLLK
ncbi:MAG: T9SS type A sorting domain-containing protein [Ignavibacteriaceae bacterium]|nr:T9SS type A sorting domain-containing protein [Ignavibacteriaceae bacterium]